MHQFPLEEDPDPLASPTLLSLLQLLFPGDTTTQFYLLIGRVKTHLCPCALPSDVPLALLTETGGLLRLAVGLMQPFSKDIRNYTPLLNQLALYFQIRDDLVNLASAEYMKAKSFCEDLTVSDFENFKTQGRRLKCKALDHTFAYMKMIA